MPQSDLSFWVRRYPILMFGMVGLVNTLIDLAVLNLLLRLSVNTYLAVAIGFGSGLTNGYYMNTAFVFRQAKSYQRYGKYFLVSMVGLLLTELIIFLLHGALDLLPIFQAKLVAVVLVFFWNYTLSKGWAFS